MMKIDPDRSSVVELIAERLAGFVRNEWVSSDFVSPMSDLPDNLDPKTLLGAIADGELTAVDHPAEFGRALADPAAATQIQQHLAFRQAVTRAMAEPLEPSNALTAKIDSLADEWLAEQEQASSTEDDGKPLPAPLVIRPWWSRPMLATAAGLALLASGLWLGRYLSDPGSEGQLAGGDRPVRIVPTQPTSTRPGSTPGPRLPVNPVPANLTRFVTLTHVGCSRSHAHHGMVMPASVAELDAPIRNYLGGETSQPDLTSIGYTYVGCGPCGRPNEKLVHFLYENVTPSGTDTLSLFVEPFKGQAKLTPGKCYPSSMADGAHPMLVWRTDELLFMLVGNAADPVEKAREALKAPSRI